MLSGLMGLGDKRRFMRALWANVALNGGVALIVAVPVMILSRWLMALYGEGFAESWDLMLLLVGSSVFTAVRDLMMQLTTSLGRVWWNTAAAASSGVILLAGTYWLAPEHGVRGYAYAWVVVTAISLSLYILFGIIAIRRSVSPDSS
jgi:O-antigen/teichoic acid export membrane protein